MFPGWAWEGASGAICTSAVLRVERREDMVWWRLQPIGLHEKQHAASELQHSSLASLFAGETQCRYGRTRCWLHAGPEGGRQPCLARHCRRWPTPLAVACLARAVCSPVATAETWQRVGRAWLGQRRFATARDPLSDPREQISDHPGALGCAATATAEAGSGPAVWGAVATAPAPAKASAVSHAGCAPTDSMLLRLRPQVQVLSWPQPVYRRFCASRYRLAGSSFSLGRLVPQPARDPRAVPRRHFSVAVLPTACRCPHPAVASPVTDVEVDEPTATLYWPPSPTSPPRTGR